MLIRIACVVNLQKMDFNMLPRPEHQAPSPAFLPIGSLPSELGDIRTPTSLYLTIPYIQTMFRWGALRPAQIGSDEMLTPESTSSRSAMALALQRTMVRAHTSLWGYRVQRIGSHTDGLLIACISSSENLYPNFLQSISPQSERSARAIHRSGKASRRWNRDPGPAPLFSAHRSLPRRLGAGVPFGIVTSATLFDASVLFVAPRPRSFLPLGRFSSFSSFSSFPTSSAAFG